MTALALLAGWIAVTLVVASAVLVYLFG